jgi:ferredoxin-NADP reductase
MHRVVREQELIFTDELAHLAASRGATVHRLVGDHRDPAGADLLGAAALERLVPDIADRDVFVCGPPPMMAHVASSLRALGVPRAQIHSERFALAT